MTPLNGLGIWIWQFRECEGGDFIKILEKAKRCGVSWICIKGADGGNLTKQVNNVTRSVLDMFRVNNIEIAAWWYSYPFSRSNELVVAHSLVEKFGFNHLLIDAEIEWETTHGDIHRSHDWRSEAKEYAKQLRKVIGDDTYLADGPWPMRSSHGVFPFDEFGEVMDARMPQFYHVLAQKPFESYAHKADAEWLLEPDSLVCPIGSPVDAMGEKHCPVEDVASFLDRYASRTACSLWSWQHLNQAEWMLLEERESIRLGELQSRKTLPEIEIEPNLCE